MDFQKLADVAEKWCSCTPFELIAAEETERRMDFYADPGVSFYVLCPDNGCGDSFVSTWGRRAALRPSSSREAGWGGVAAAGHPGPPSRGVATSRGPRHARRVAQIIPRESPYGILRVGRTAPASTSKVRSGGGVLPPRGLRHNSAAAPPIRAPAPSCESLGRTQSLCLHPQC